MKTQGGRASIRWARGALALYGFTGVAAASAACGPLEIYDPQSDASTGPGTSSTGNGQGSPGSADGGGNEDAGPDCAAETADGGLAVPNDLECTGLYASFADRTIAAEAQPFDPGLRMWNDGATSLRWILLPAGQKIDTTDMNEWSFPVGTRIWQELSLSGHRVETRFLWKRGANDWVRGAYAWSSDETQAIYTPGGVTNVGGSSYEIPSAGDCDSCHLGRQDHVLGFEAVSLSTPQATGLTISALAAKGLLTSPPSAPLAIPDDGTGRGVTALGWLHANCGTSCHNASASSPANGTGLFLRLEVGSANGMPTLGSFTSTQTYVTAVNVPATLSPYAALGWRRITPNDPFLLVNGSEGTSLLPTMAKQRNNASLQMPPIDTNLPDFADVTALEDWITNGSFQ